MVRIWVISLFVTMAIALLVLSAPGRGVQATHDSDRELSIVIDADFNTYLGDVATAGSNRIILENETSASIGVSLYLVPDEVLSRVEAFAGTPEIAVSGLPRWLNEAIPVGGPGSAGPGDESEAFVDLDVGSYVVVFTLFPLQNGQLPSFLLTFDDGQPFVIAVTEPPPTGGASVTAAVTISAAGATDPTQTAELSEDDEVTEEPAGSSSEATEEPDSSTEATEEPSGPPEPSVTNVTIVMTDNGFQLPGTFQRGPQTWEIVNQGQVPHALIVVAVPDGTTTDQLLALLFPGPKRTEATFDISAIINIGGLGPLAPGLSAGTTFNLEAGTYAMFSALPDPITGEPDGARGLLAVFIVV